MNSDETRWHTLTQHETLGRLKSREEGLTKDEANRRKEQYGPNELEEVRRKSVVRLFFEQFANVMIWVLLAAALISGMLSEWVDTAIILAVVLINALLGTIQESRAEAALDSLKKMAAPMARVVRDGAAERIPAGELVPGDVVHIEAGDFVPADLRLLMSASLRVEESTLTGESVPVEKSTDALADPEVPLGDRVNLCFSGSSVTYGRGLGVVVETGMRTQIGRIASGLAAPQDETTPLQRKLAQISRVLSAGVLIVAVVVFAVGLLTGREPFEMFLTAVSLAVAAIPEGLVAVVTIVLALGMQRMAGRGAIIRKLPAVETLGGTQIICSDKTGTLTVNRMAVRALWLEDAHRESGDPPADSPVFSELCSAMVRCNDAQLSSEGRAVGDPTETALIDYALNVGAWTADAVRARTRDGEIPFDSERKLMTTAHAVPGGFRVYVKGAPDVLLHRCTRVLGPQGESPMDEAAMERAQAANTEMAQQALRVLAFAYKDAPAFDAADITGTESELVLVGLAGMIDPPRDEARQAVAACREAGIMPVMITGDHRITAEAIARDLGILREGYEAVSGTELSRMNDMMLSERIRRFAVYARVAPEHKVRIVDAWQRRGYVVAMTGDGVNDAPALKAADIGIGMGITGTDVSKGASDMVLTDDNFATIVRAVEEGRKIYGNIRKTVRFLLSSNFGEVIALFAATLAGWRLLYPIHILWINLVTDTFPALALGVEPTEGDVMRHPPRDPSQPFLMGRDWRDIVVSGTLEGALALAAFLIGRWMAGETLGTTMAFVTLGLSQIFYSVASRSERNSVFALGLLKNKVMVGAFLLSAALQVSVALIPPLRTLFGLVAMNGAHWLIVAGLSASMLLFGEIFKGALRLGARRRVSPD
ncbi:MAG: cation-translocating P-type ATPase [Clostridiales bacterium]|nr:cation-translocating P-type ATPase [Clostridiales bacterium]